VLRGRLGRSGYTATSYGWESGTTCTRRSRKATSSRYDGLFVFSNPFTYSERREIAGLAAANRLPAIYEARGSVVALVINMKTAKGPRADEIIQ
jgi:hypothetical protein